MADVWAGISIGVVVTLIFNSFINSIYIIFFKEDFENFLRRIKQNIENRRRKINDKIFSGIKKPLNYFNENKNGGMNNESKNSLF